MTGAAKQARGSAALGQPAPRSGHVQNVSVGIDEAGMRVDRFLEARFPGLSFSHIQRIIRKGELRVNGSACAAQATTRGGAGGAHPAAADG